MRDRDEFWYQEGYEQARCCEPLGQIDRIHRWRDTYAVAIRMRGERRSLRSYRAFLRGWTAARKS